MSNDLSNELKNQMFSQESDDPFLALVTLTHTSFTARLVNNTRDITSNGFVFSAFPMKIRLPPDDGESARDFAIEFDNVSLDLITQLRSVTGDIGVKIQLILASMPDVVQMEYTDLLIRSVSYNKHRVSARIVLDSFLAVEMTSEKYTPALFPGMFQ
jgi:hypothetical protein